MREAAMNERDPVRLSESSGDGFEASLLASARDDGMSPAMKRRMAGAIAGSAVLTVAASKAAAAKAAPHASALVTHVTTHFTTHAAKWAFVASVSTGLAYGGYAAYEAVVAPAGPNDGTVASAVPAAAPPRHAPPRHAPVVAPPAASPSEPGVADAIDLPAEADRPPPVSEVATMHAAPPNGSANARAQVGRVAANAPPPSSQAPATAMAPNPTRVTGTATPSVAGESAPTSPRPEREAPRAVEAPAAVLARVREETRLVDAARRALAAGDAQRALSLTREHRERFPSGELVEEAELVSIAAHRERGDRARARAEAEAFLARRPKSPYAQRVKRLGGLAGEEATNATEAAGRVER
jgi:hypothetical protein